MDKVFITGLEIYAHHGVFDEERKIGQYYRVDVEMSLNFEQAAQNDDLQGTVNYQQACDLITREMKTPSKLIEHAANRIINALKEAFPQLSSVKIKLSKLSPPVAQNLEAVSVVIER